ncbi:MAG: hypothetical protein ACF8LL_09270 [Phycisphaerales bacterium]
MLELTPGMLAVFIICSAVAVLAMLRVLANIVEHETDLHDLRNRVKELQYQRELRNAQLSGRVGREQDDPPKDAIEATERAIDAAERVADAFEQPQPAPAQAA